MPESVITKDTNNPYLRKTIVNLKTAGAEAQINIKMNDAN